MPKESSLALIDNNMFPALTNPTDVQELMDSNIGEGENISFSDLVRIKMPSGEIQAFMVPNMETSEMDAVKSVEGIILQWSTQRAFWPLSISEGGDPQPLCFSRDGVIGEGDPRQTGMKTTQQCSDCPNSQYESAPDGKRQWCKLMRRLYLLRPGEMLPTILTLPPSSIKPVKTYMAQLTSRGVPYYLVNTSIGLVGEEASRANDKGKIQKIKYMKASFRIAGYLNDEQKNMLRSYRNMMLPFINRFSQTDTPNAEDAATE